MPKDEGQRRWRLALLDDDTRFLEVMSELLNEEGYEVLVRREADNAYGFVKHHHPDLVILDIRMGVEERGWTILNLLTLNPQTRPLPVLVCSAAIESLHEHQPWLDKFCICALPKPFDVNMLLEMVSRMLPEDSEAG